MLGECLVKGGYEMGRQNLVEGWKAEVLAPYLQEWIGGVLGADCLVHTDCPCVDFEEFSVLRRGTSGTRAVRHGNC
jgi:hypothetical protein